MCSAACASSRFLPSEAYGGSFPTTPIPGCMSYWISWALITGCTHGLQVRASSERLEGRRLKKKPTDSTGQRSEMVDEKPLPVVFLADTTRPEDRLLVPSFSSPAPRAVPPGAFTARATRPFNSYPHDPPQSGNAPVLLTHIIAVQRAPNTRAWAGRRPGPRRSGPAPRPGR